MGDIIRFPGRKKKSWTRPQDYGHRPGKPPRPPRPPRRPFLSGLRPWLLLVALLTAWKFYDPMLMDPPAFLSTDPETVSATFARCNGQRATHCVIDGDTFHIGARRIRLIGIDAPETHPARCPAEAQAGEAATAALQRLLSAGAFTMTARIDNPTDGYGRELRSLSRKAADGSTQSIAAQMVAGGFARRYAGGLRRSWCDPAPGAAALPPRETT